MNDFTQEEKDSFKTFIENHIIEFFNEKGKTITSKFKYNYSNVAFVYEIDFPFVINDETIMLEILNSIKTLLLCNDKSKKTNPFYIWVYNLNYNLGFNGNTYCWNEGDPFSFQIIIEPLCEIALTSANIITLKKKIEQNKKNRHQDALIKQMFYDDLLSNEICLNSYWLYKHRQCGYLLK